jgi:tRNA A37 threonylcarbamoyladenosine dehydratase
MNTEELNLPTLTQIDWRLVSDANVVFVGVGAVGRPLPRGLARLGMRRAVVADPKRYRERSVL